MNPSAVASPQSRLSARSFRALGTTATVVVPDSSNVDIFTLDGWPEAEQP
jgi:hypothetical protein